MIGRVSMTGYNVGIIAEDIRIKHSKFDQAYNTLCELNKRDDLKKGKASFKFMDPDYPNKCKTLEEVLEALGFEVTVGTMSDIEMIGLDYFTDHGDELIFLEALAPYIDAGSYIEWEGEDCFYKCVFDGQNMKILDGDIVYS